MGSNLLEKESYVIRPYGIGDEAELRLWLDGHRLSGDSFNAGLLPPLGVVVEVDGEPVSCCFAYMSVRVGVAFLEFAVTRPGLSVLEAKNSLGAAIEGIEELLKVHDYNVVQVVCEEALAKRLEAIRGFERLSSNCVSLIKILK